MSPHRPVVQKARTSRPRSGEEGIIFAWTAILLLPVLTLGMIFLVYGRANMAKLEAQFNAMNLVAIGTFSAEFDSKESLNAMAMLARAQGFSTAIPTRAVQTSSSGTLVFNHDTTVIGESKVVAFERMSLGPLSNLVAHLGGIDSAGISRSKPSKIYLSVLLDYSRSLLNDRKITDLLRAFGVLAASSDTVAGVNGVFDSSVNLIIPNYVARNALPFGINSVPRFWLAWLTNGPTWPNFEWTLSRTICQEGPENVCTGGTPSHVGAIMSAISNLFMSYKRAATILVGVLAQHSLHLDVGVLGAPMPTVTANEWSRLTQPSSGAPINFETFSNTGYYPVWRYDEVDLKNFTPTGQAQPQLSAQVGTAHSFSDPKNPFEDGVNLAPTRVLPNNLLLTGYRKALKYFKFEDETGAQYSFSDTQLGVDGAKWFPSALAYLSPPLPKVANPKFNPPPTDSFVYEPGPRGTDGKLTNELWYPYGWPTAPRPWVATEGPAHPTAGNLPDEIKEIREYTGLTGPPRSNNGQLSKNLWETGFGLCLVRDLGDDGMQNGSVPCTTTTAFTPSQLNWYLANPTSPMCPGAGFAPRCRRSATEASDTSFVWCINGYPMCAPFTGDEPGCFQNTAGSLHQGTFSNRSPRCLPPGEYPQAFKGDPVYRGRLVAPVQAPTITTNNLFYFLMDLGPTYGGTFHQAGVLDANDRCGQFLSRSGNKGRCALVMLTDGAPNPRDFNGQPLITIEAALSQLEAELNTFTGTLGGRSYTWFLGRKDQYDMVKEIGQGVYNSLTAAQKAILDLYVYPGISVPAGSCADFNSISALGVKCTYYNGVILPDRASLGQFKDLLGGGATPRANRVWTESAVLSDGTTGAPSIGAATDPGNNPFIKGLKLLLATLKSQVEYDR